MKYINSSASSILSHVLCYYLLLDVDVTTAFSFTTSLSSSTAIRHTKQQCLSFRHPSKQHNINNYNNNKKYFSTSLQSFLIEEETNESDNDKKKEVKSSEKQFDGKGNEIKEGSIVRLVKPLRAYHVSQKGWGSFDEDTKQFIPTQKKKTSEDSKDKKKLKRSEKCLVMPVGLKGTVVRVYDLNDVEASQPILTKFVKGGEIEEGEYQSPLTFQMHFLSSEVECVL